MKHLLSIDLKKTEPFMKEKNIRKEDVSFNPP